VRIARPSSQPPACLDIELKSVFVPCLCHPGAFFGQTTGSRSSIYVSRSQKRPQVPPQVRSNNVLRNPIAFPIRSYVRMTLLAHIATIRRKLGHPIGCVKGEVQLEAPPAPSPRYAVPAVPAGVLGWRSECWLTPRRKTAGCVYGYQQQSQQAVAVPNSSTNRP